MKRFVTLLMVFLTLFGTQSAAAQSWTVGPVTPEWQSATTWVPPIDPDAVHPADTYEPAVSANDDVLYTRESWVDPSNQRINVGTSDEAKFRTNCKPTFIKRADPLLFPGQYPVGHGHTFFGPMDPFVIANVEDFDYAMGRAHPASACDGGPLNATLYWEPSMYDERYGVRLTVMPEQAAFYYTHPPAERDDTTRLRRNFRFISGADPMNFNDYAKRQEYAAAGLLYPSTNTPAGFLGIQCAPAATGGTSGPAAPVLEAHQVTLETGTGYATQARYLKDENGNDPWGGACTAGHIVIWTIAPGCWDGVNLSSPNGRDHVRYSARAGDNEPPAGQCPDNYVKIMHFESKVFFAHDGWEEDLQHWYFSSDRMDPAVTVEDVDPDTGLATCSNDPVTQGDDCSMDACRKVGPYYCNGATAHFDWWGAWDNQTIEEWEKNCGGLTIGGVTTNFADCGTSGLDTNRSMLLSGTPPEPGLSTDPVGDDPTERASDSAAGQKYFPVNPDDQNQDALTLEVHPHG